MQIKKEFRWFSIFEYEKEQEYLRRQHQAGWKFLRVKGLGVYYFEQCTPEDVVYQLDYNREGAEHRAEYVRMFEDCGWEFLQEYAGYTYFRKRAAVMHGDEEIFCDDSSRLAMLERVYKGRLLPLLVLFCACLLPQFILNLTAGRYGLAAFMGGILAVYAVAFGFSAVYYYRYRRRLHL